MYILEVFESWFNIKSRSMTVETIRSCSNDFELRMRRNLLSYIVFESLNLSQMSVCFVLLLTILYVRTKQYHELSAFGYWFDSDLKKKHI